MSEEMEVEAADIFLGLVDPHEAIPCTFVKGRGWFVATEWVVERLAKERTEAWEAARLTTDGKQMHVWDDGMIDAAPRYESLSDWEKAREGK